MKHHRLSFFARGGALAAASVLAPLLVAYLYVGTCGGGKSGFVLAFRAGKVAVTAAWCEASPPRDDRS